MFCSAIKLVNGLLKLQAFEVYNLQWNPFRRNPEVWSAGKSPRHKVVILFIKP